MKKFEYKTVSFGKSGGLFKSKEKSSPDEELNKLGQEGWECVSVYSQVIGGSATEINYLFKRETE
ncbi:DUF4177 domain-containing protein [Cytobacillus oceanisediminis]|uniref:DUF4177 domain-containing protein n=1 Tax=Cytobacillus oceanisediminis TaxID=665099 RepID=UPI001863ECCE|nr:DUF4177 domain-containing protein [Cytobacillus oceanisediminis]QOK28081.1 DUF4177 domain-containing protein [Cytobacillus oceanisediminis]